MVAASLLAGDDEDPVLEIVSVVSIALILCAWGSYAGADGNSTAAEPDIVVLVLGQQLLFAKCGLVFGGLLTCEEREAKTEDEKKGKDDGCVLRKRRDTSSP